MFCPHCKASLPPNAVFCASCGNPVHKANKHTKKPREPKRKLMYLLFLVPLLVVSGFVVKRYQPQLFADVKSPFSIVKSGVQSIAGKESTINTNNVAQNTDKPTQGTHNGNGIVLNTGSSDELSIMPVCDAYMNIQTDGEYLYYWTEMDLFRINRQTFESEVVLRGRDFAVYASNEKIFTSMIDSFCLTKDYLYFSLKKTGNENYPCSYYRIPKAGGELELLFLMPQSYMVAQDEEIYMLFASSKQIGVYNQDKNTLPQLIPVMDIPERDSTPRAPFSVCDGYLYYNGVTPGGNFILHRNYYRTNLSTGVTQKIIDHQQKGLSHIRNGIFVDNSFFFASLFQNSYTMIKRYDMLTGRLNVIQGYKGEMERFLAVDDGYFLFPKNDNGVYERMPVATPNTKEEFYEGKPMSGGTSSEIERNRLEKYCDGLILEFSNGYDMRNDKHFKLPRYAQDDDPTLYQIIDQPALKQMANLLVKYKDVDCSAGVLP